MDKQDQILSIKLTRREAHALLRLIARANDDVDTSRADREMGSWIVQRIGRQLDPAYFGVAP